MMLLSSMLDYQVYKVEEQLDPQLAHLTPVIDLLLGCALLIFSLLAGRATDSLPSYSLPKSEYTT